MVDIVLGSHDHFEARYGLVARRTKACIAKQSAWKERVEGRRTVSIVSYTHRQMDIIKLLIIELPHSLGPCAYSPFGPWNGQGKGRDN